MTGKTGSGDRRRVRHLPHPLVADIVAVLMEHANGSAHQDVVISQIAARRGHVRATEELAQEVILAFEQHLAFSKRRTDGPVLLKRAFGEGSRRWALEPIAYTLFQKPAPAQPAWPVRLQA